MPTLGEVGSERCRFGNLNCIMEFYGVVSGKGYFLAQCVLVSEVHHGELPHFAVRTSVIGFAS